MEVDKVTDMSVDKVADMEVDMVAGLLNTYLRWVSDYFDNGFVDDLRGACGLKLALLVGNM